MGANIELAFARAKRRDRVAGGIIVVGGIAIIITVVAMLLLILGVALPLFGTPNATVRDTFQVALAPGASPVATGVDDYFELGYVVDSHGSIHVLNLAEHSTREILPLRDDLRDGLVIRAVERWDGAKLTLLWSDRKSTSHSIRLKTEFDTTGERHLKANVVSGAGFGPVSNHQLLSTAIRSAEDRTTYVEMAEDRSISVHQIEQTEDFLGNVDRQEKSFPLVLDQLDGEPAVFALSSDGERLYVGSDSGHIGAWDLRAIGVPEFKSEVRQSTKSITALGFVLGEVTLAAGSEDGQLAGWFEMEHEAEIGKRLARAHDLAPMPGAIREIQPTRRNKVVLARDDSGRVAFHHMTSERHLLDLTGSDSLVFGLSEKGDAVATFDRAGTMTLWQLDMPHPETSWSTLFGRVLYEGYSEPRFIWQSSSPSDDYEPKLSLIPLIFGTFKGAIYALIFAVPLSLLAAIYTSQFARPEFRAIIKPVVEVMASIPSVVVGFLIALWLAPIVDDFLLAFFLVLFMLPLTFLIFIALYATIDNTPLARRIARGYEFVVIAPIIILAVALSGIIAVPLEDLLFGGNLQLWIYEHLGERYDQRNAIIIAIGLGFAAIPIIFTMAEDALSNLPTSLRAASLALGASRWQTVWRVVFPSASPGIFAAMIVGFGRVIGETMIVLMATGNTPIIDWSPFNGMRTLSANIAVEIPEAPVGGTLYRILFLSAVILFGITFVLNTFAEIIRQRLRRKYGRY